MKDLDDLFHSKLYICLHDLPEELKVSSISILYPFDNNP